MKECWEEASIPPELALHAKAVGAVSYMSLKASFFKKGGRWQGWGLRGASGGWFGWAWRALIRVTRAGARLQQAWCRNASTPPQQASCV